LRRSQVRDDSGFEADFTPMEAANLPSSRNASNKHIEMQ
jgi:hypothetical protein